MGYVYFSTHTPQPEIERLTAYNFSCLTRYTPCRTLGDLLPTARASHLYDPAPDTATPYTRPTLGRRCDVPVWALARDARFVLSVEARSTSTEPNPSLPTLTVEKSTIRVLATLKDPTPWPPGTVVAAYPYVYSSIEPAEAEHLIPGQRYLIFPAGADRPDLHLTSTSPIRLDRCGVQDDTPRTRLALEQGFAQNDNLNP